MQQRVEPDYFALSPLSPEEAASSVHATVRLGPARRVKLLARLPFFRQGPPLLVPEPLKPLWFTKHWRRSADGKSYSGSYSAAGRSWRGLIQEPYAQGYVAYIWQPPIAQIRHNTSHGPCFNPSGESGRYQIYFHNVPSSLDHAITSIETVLTQALRSRA